MLGKRRLLSRLFWIRKSDRIRTILKVLYFVSLPCAYAWVTIVNPFLANGMPTGWDTGAYLAWTNALKTGGLNYVQNPSFIQYNALNLIPVLLLYANVSLAQSNLVGYVTFQLMVISMFFFSTLLLSLRLNKSVLYAMVSFAVLATSFSFLRSTRDLYGNLICVSFLQFAFTALLEVRESKKLYPKIALAEFTALMFFTDIEIAAFGATALILSVASMIVYERRPLRKGFRLSLPILIGIGIAGVFWLPLAKTYVSVSTISYAVGGTADWGLAITELGGSLMLPICLFGVGLVLYKWHTSRGTAPMSSLSGWVVTFAIFVGIVVAYRPTLLFRVALLIPIYFLVSEVVMFLVQNYRHHKFQARVLKASLLLIMISVGVAIAFESAVTFAQQTTGYETSPYIPQQDYGTLANVGNYLHSIHSSPSSTVFLIFPQQRTSQPQYATSWTNLYDNWIFAAIGSHLTYYGTIENLTAGAPISFAFPGEKLTYQSYRDSFNTGRTGSVLTVVIVSFMYSGSSASLSLLSSPVAGAFIQRIDLSNPFQDGWIPSFFATSTSGSYFTPLNGSLYGRVLESYSPTSSSSNFRADFPVYADSSSNYEVDLRMMDYDPSNSPITVSLDNRTIFAFNYFGTLAARTFSGEVGFLGRGHHELTVTTIPMMPHFVDLDGVKIVPTATASTSGSSPVLGDWKLVDGTGTVFETSTYSNTGVVAGSPSPSSNVLGARENFTQAQDFSGSRFLVFKLNSTQAISIFLWLTDSSGNTIRYTLNNYAMGRNNLFVSPVALVDYDYISPVAPDFSSIHSVEIGVSNGTLGQLEFGFAGVSITSGSILPPSVFL